MSINMKILKKVDEKTKLDPELKKAATNLLRLESEGVGAYKDEYRKIIEKSDGEIIDEN
jgi:hypothetical protein